jgi:hypothetical protein
MMARGVEEEEFSETEKISVIDTERKQQKITYEEATKNNYGFQGVLLK